MTIILVVLLLLSAIYEVNALQTLPSSRRFRSISSVIVAKQANYPVSLSSTILLASRSYDTRGNGGRYDSFRGSGGRGGYRGGSSGGRSGGRSRYENHNSLEDLSFSKTVKIDSDVQAPIEDMNLSPPTAKVLKDKGFTLMTPVQTQSYDHVYSGVDVVARSKTGTGKTLAFGIPLIEKLVSENAPSIRDRKNLPLILILEPTRELAMQVAQELSAICDVHRLRVTTIYGGVPYPTQERALMSGMHIVVATPGRALDHISRGNLDLSNVKHVVLDEGDTMLEMGFQKSVETILANVKIPGEKSRLAAQKSLLAMGDGADNADDRNWSSRRSPMTQDDDDEDDEDYDDLDDSIMEKSSPKSRQVQMLLFSATMAGWICKLTAKHMNDPIFLDAVEEGEGRLPDTIKHLSMRLPSTSSSDKSRLNAFVEDLILTKGGGGQTIIFTNTKEEADGLISSDCFGQLKAQVLHGDISQNTRQSTIRAFKEGLIEVLVATDVAARGLDIANVDLVIHSGPPNDFDTFVHRSGRTGRAGRNGTNVMLYSSTTEERRLSTFERALTFKFDRVQPATPQEIAQASVIYATRKLDKVSKGVVRHFLPHAKELIRNMIDEKEEDGNLESVEEVFARCLAALSNKNSIATRSAITGESGKMTLLVNALFKNGTTPNTIRDWQRVFAGVVRRSVPELEDIRFGRLAMGRTPDRQFCGLIDVDADQGQKILDSLDVESIPKGISVGLCEKLPDLVDDGSDRFGGGERSPYGSRSGGYGRDRERSYGSYGSRDRGGYASRDSPRSPYGGSSREDPWKSSSRSSAGAGGPAYSRNR